MNDAELSKLTGVLPERRKEIESALVKEPLGSYIFSGPAGTGKSTFMKALYNRVDELQPRNGGFLDMAHCRKLVFKEAYTWQVEVTEYRCGKRESAFSSLDVENDHHHPYSVFLDDVDKLKGSEFIDAEFQNLINVLVVKNAQLVMTTNFSKERFIEQFGGPIQWRIQKHCRWIEMSR